MAQIETFVADYESVTFLNALSEPMQNPLHGGFNNPVPQLVDIDLDGDLDLFIQEERSHLQLYLNTGSAASPVFEIASRNYQGLDVGDWFRFADADADGDPDLFVEQPFNAIRYYENSGGSAPEFTLIADTLYTSSGLAITTESPNVPVIKDIDCNGRLDLLLGKLDGSVTRFEESTQPANLPTFDFVEDNFQDILVVGPLGKNDSRHGASVLDLADMDGNGTADLLWGDFFATSLLTFLNNTTDCSQINLEIESDTLVSTNQGNFITRGYNAPAAGDLTGDGVNDLIVGTLSNAAVDDEKNLSFFENHGSGSFLWRTDDLIQGVDVGSANVPALVDINADGIVDLVVANNINNAGQAAELFLFEGISPGVFMASESNILQADLGFSYHPDFGDLDSDGDQDLVVGTFGGNVFYLENIGTPIEPEYELISESITGEDIGSNAAPELADLDNDGDLDLIVGESSGAINYYENTGGTTSPVFASSTDLFDGFDVGQGSAPAFLDTDSDGDLDMIVGSENSGLYFFENTGTPTVPDFGEPTHSTLHVPQKATPEVFFEDSPGNGADGLLVGGISGGLLLFTEPGASSIAVDTEPHSLNLDVYPNPATEFITIVFSSSSADQRWKNSPRYAVIDMLGRSVLTGEFLLRKVDSPFRLEISSLPAGVYMVQVNGGDSMSAASTFVKLSSRKL